MIEQTKKVKLSSDVPAELFDKEKIISWIAEITNQSKETVHSRLYDEFNSPGINVCRGFKRANLTAHIYSEQLAHFYQETDAFLYELVIWNMNRLKRRMRYRIADFLNDNQDEPLNVLMIGDGLGFDSLYYAMLGHNVTYFELDGYCLSFALKLFDHYNQDITVLSNPDNIPEEKFDAVICLDVLEHVPDPQGFVKAITGYLKNDGRLIIHTPFFMIHPSNPTHLKQNRRFSGLLSLFEQHRLKLIGGRFCWNPLILRKQNSQTKKRPAFNPNLFLIKLAGLYLRLGRFSVLPFCWINSYRKNKNKWFEK